MGRSTVIFLGLVLPMLTISLTTAAAQESPSLVKCWDETYAYTQFDLQEASTGYEFRLASQDGTVFAPLFPDLDLVWGDMEIRVTFAAAQCEVDPKVKRFTCAAEPATHPITLRDLRGGSNATLGAIKAQELRARLVDVVDVNGAVVRKILSVNARVVTSITLSGGDSSAKIAQAELRKIEVPLTGRGCQIPSP